MQMLNLPGGAQTAPGAPPRLMSARKRSADARADAPGAQQDDGADPRPAGRDRR
jgi:hypothetical protein